MGGKKALLARLLLATGLMQFGLRRARGDLLILAYHRVLNVPDEDSFCSDPELVSASVSEFRRQISFVRDHWNPIALSAAVDAIDKKQALPARSVVITFDDGHFDNYAHAFPVLRELAVPATIFLSTQYIDGTEPFWFDRISTLLFFAPSGAHRVPGTDTVLELAGVASRRTESDRLLAVLKHLPDAQRCEILRSLEALLGPHVPARDPAVNAALTWDQVREMAQHGIEFGSHTVTHPVLSMQTDAEIRFELAHSRQTIQEQSGKHVDLLAYPVGKAYAFNDKVIAIAKECGYRAALAYIDGANDPAQADRFALSRIAVERYIPHSLFMARMTFPRVFV